MMYKGGKKQGAKQAILNLALMPLIALNESNQIVPEELVAAIVALLNAIISIIRIFKGRE